MKKLIELGVAIDIAIGAADEYDGGYNFERDRKIRDALMALPTVDAVPVRHGRWREDTGGYGFWICSHCGFVSEASAADLLYRYCPMCGAKMNGRTVTTMTENELFGNSEQLESSHEKDHVADPDKMVCGLIRRRSALDAIKKLEKLAPTAQHLSAIFDCEDIITALPSAQPPKEIPKRVLWSGWKGCRDTRYKCPNCEKPVRNDDAYCHRCGQRLMFPKISFTDYVPGEKQDVIVRWDDEG